MNIKTQRVLDRTIGSLLCRILSFLPQKKALPVDAEPKNILIILLSEMGSLILARPMFHDLKQRYPNARIHVLLFEKNREFLDILNEVPPSQVFTLNDRTLRRFSLECLQLWKTVRAAQIDTVIDCELFSRVSSIFSYFSGARNRVGFYRYNQEGLYRGNFINRPVAYNPYQHISHQFISLARAIATNTNPGNKQQLEQTISQQPPLPIAPKELESFQQRLEEKFPDILSNKLVLIYPGGGLLPIRAWPIENYCDTAHSLNQQGYHVATIGLAQDQPLAEQVSAACNNQRCYDLTGFTRDIHELITLFQLAALLITNDGGPGHFASLSPIPAIIFFGPETPHLYRPLDLKSTVFYAKVSCSPCLTAYNHRNSACDGDNVCLKSISTESVLQQANIYLTEDEKNWQKGGQLCHP